MNIPLVCTVSRVQRFRHAALDVCCGKPLKEVCDVGHIVAVLFQTARGGLIHLVTFLYVHTHVTV